MTVKSGGNMNCRNIEKNLIDYIEGLLSPDEHAEIETHLKNCSECREKYRGAQLIGELMGDESENIQEPDWDKIYRRAEYSAAGRPQNFRFRSLAAAAVLVLVFGAGMLLNNFLNSDRGVIKRAEYSGNLIDKELIGNLEDCRVVLLEIANMSSLYDSTTTRRVTAELLRKNRRFALNNGDKVSRQLNKLLSELELLLIEIKNLSGDEYSREYVRSFIRKRKILLKIERIFLDFKMNKGGRDVYLKNKKSSSTAYTL